MNKINYFIQSGKLIKYYLLLKEQAQKSRDLETCVKAMKIERLLKEYKFYFETYDEASLFFPYLFKMDFLEKRSKYCISILNMITKINHSNAGNKWNMAKFLSNNYIKVNKDMIDMFYEGYITTRLKPRKEVRGNYTNIYIEDIEAVYNAECMNATA